MTSRFPLLRRRFLRPRKLAQDSRGATILEFAFVAPVLVLMLMFMFDTGYYFYARSILGGEMQAAGRNSTMETATAANQTALNTQVETAVKRLVSGADIQFSRIAYRSYGRAQSKAEKFKDKNKDGICNNKELFDDENNNKTYDKDAGASGQGGASDVAIYTATLEYDRVFPIARMLGWNNRVTMTSSTILRNQPFDKKGNSAEEHCP